MKSLREVLSFAIRASISVKCKEIPEQRKSTIFETGTETSSHLVLKTNYLENQKYIHCISFWLGE